MANFHSDEWVMARIQDHYDAMEERYGNRLIGVFCVGSTNYGLDIETSDVDSKALVLPTLEEISLLKEPTSETYKLYDREQIDIKDIRLAIKLWKKQSINMLEVLFTKYFIVNPRFEQIWNEIKEEADEIARYDMNKAINSMGGMAHTRYKMWLKALDNGERDGKSLVHIVRMFRMMRNYEAGYKYERLLYEPDGDYFKRLRNGEISLKEEYDTVDLCMHDIDWVLNNMKPKMPNVDIELFLNDKLLEFMRMVV